MQADLRAQEEFLMSGEKPSATVVREKAERTSPSPSQTAGPTLLSALTSVKEIRERDRTRDKVVIPLNAPEKGFPTAERVTVSKGQKGRKSLFRQSMESKARQQKQASMQTVPAVPSLNETDVVKMERSFSREIDEKDIQRDVQEMLGQMTEEEKLQARDELLQSLDPSLIAFLKKRSTYKEMKGRNPTQSDGAVREMNGAVREVGRVREEGNVVPRERERTIEIEAAEEVKESTEEVARRVANAIDYTTLRTEDDLDDAVSRLPAAEQEKLQWTLPAPATSNPSSPRFDFNGVILPPSASSTIAVHSGLYNHGEEADLPGYTLAELFLLSRSAVSGQRVLALKCIYNVLRRRSRARELSQKLSPEHLPVTILRVLCLLLERRSGVEEVFLALRCLEELCSTQEEHNRRLLLNLSYRGYEYAYVQDPAALAFECDDCDLGEKDPFREANCGNMFTMLYEADILSKLFSCTSQFSMHPPVVASVWSLLCVLVESDKRFGEAIIDSHAFFTQMEKNARELLDPGFVDGSYSASASPELSCRASAMARYANSPLAVTLHFLTAVEALVRHSRKNASNIVRSAVLPALKQWLLFFQTADASQTVSFATECVVEGALSCWRLCLLYGLDVDSIDAFLPALLRIAQFGQPCNRVLTWSVLEVSVRTKLSASTRYFVEYCNALVLLAVEQMAVVPPVPPASPASPVRTAVTHFLASYVEAVNELAEREDAEAEVAASLGSQVLQLGYVAMKDCPALLRSVAQSHRSVYRTWAEAEQLPNVTTDAAAMAAEAPRPAFSPAEAEYLRDGDACFAASRLALAGVQNSRRFVALLRDGGWIDAHVDFLTAPLWRDCHTTPRSPALTYLSRALILAEVNWALLLHVVLPVEARLLATHSPSSTATTSTTTSTSTTTTSTTTSTTTANTTANATATTTSTTTANAIASTARARVWRSAWQLLQLLLPGDEYAALELLVHVLLDPVSVKCYCENRSESAALAVDLDCVTTCLVQQLGDGRLVEHSQSLTFCSYADRRTLLLLPYRIKPALPLLPHWLFMPLFLLRFRQPSAEPSSHPSAHPAAEPSAESSAGTLHTEADMLQFLRFVYELERSACGPLLPEDRAMRCFGLLHVAFAGHDVVFSEAVEEQFWAILRLYGVERDGCHCKAKCDAIDELAKHDAIDELASAVPAKEVVGYLEKCCDLITEEYYGCPFLLRVVLLFVRPCREWAYRVAVLNYFLDQDYAHVLLRAAAETAWGGRAVAMLEEKTAKETMDTLYAEYAQNYECVWEEKEEVIEMMLRYMEQAIRHLPGYHPEFVINPLSFWVRHYVEARGSHYQFFRKELDRLCSVVF